MGASVIDAIVRGNRGAWVGLFAAVLVAAVIALTQRPHRTSIARVLVLSGITSVLSAFGILAAMALSVPKIVWRSAPLPPFAMASGSSWRSLRAPAAAVLDGDRPDIGLPGLDATGSVRLFGILSGAPIAGYAPAPEAPPLPGRARICRIDREECRAWPLEWPEPTAAPTISELGWTRDLFSGAIAYDVETGRFLHQVTGVREVGAPIASTGSATAESVRALAGTWALEQIGRFSNEPAKDGEAAIFVVRRIVGGRLDAVRVVSKPAEGSFSYTMQRATVSLSAGPSALAWFARPLLLTLVLWFPVVTILFQAAPAWWAAKRRKAMAEGQPLSEMPSDAASFARRARQQMASQLHGLSLLCVGLALLAPAVVAVAEIVTSR